MNDPHQDDTMLALGWMKEPERMACERTLASDPSRTVSLRRNEDMVAQLGALGPLHPAPASVRTAAMAALAADRASGFVSDTNSDNAAPPPGNRSAPPAERPRSENPSRRRLLRHPLAGWVAAAAIAAVAGFHRGAEVLNRRNGDHAEPDRPVWGAIHRKMAWPSAENDGQGEDASPATNPSSGAGKVTARTALPSPRPPAPLTPRTARLATALPSANPSGSDAEESTSIPPSSLNRMVVIVLRPPNAPIPPDLFATNTITDRIATAVANDPSWLSTNAGELSETGALPDDPSLPPAEAPWDPGLVPDEGPVSSTAPSVPATPSAWAIFNETSGEGSLIVDSLPPLGTEEAYQIWLIDQTSQAPVSVGLLPPLPDGSGHVNFTFTGSGLSPQDFLITKERATGASTPSDSVVLRRP